MYKVTVYEDTIEFDSCNYKWKWMAYVNNQRIKYTSFPCTSCGSCCKRIGNAERILPIDIVNPLHFPYNKDSSGKCEKLKDDNTCSVYENRPLVCNIEKTMEFYGLSRDEFFQANIEVCNIIMDEDGVDLSFRIKE
jgi:Fe-S-cluster containining protein